MEPIFPLEIFNLVIDEVATMSTDKADLFACSLVSKDFAHLCRARIFKDLKFIMSQTGAPRLKLRGLANTILKNPSLRGYTRRISYRQLGSALPWTENSYDEELDSCLATLLHLPNVSDLSIIVYRGSIDYERRRSDVFGCRSLIEQYLLSSSLTRLHLEGKIVNIPLLLILSSPKLAYLKLSECHLLLWTPQEQPPQDDTIKLQTLIISHVLHFPYSLLKRLTKLEHLELTGPPDNSSVPPHILPFGEPSRFESMRTLVAFSDMDWESFLRPEFSNSIKALPILQELEIELYLDQDVSAANAIFVHLQVLKSFYLHGMTSDNVFRRLQLYKGIGDMCSTLRTLKMNLSWDKISQMVIDMTCDSFNAHPKHSLESFTLFLAFQIHHPNELEGEFAEWRRLALCMLERDRFPVLKYVKVLVCFNINGVSQFKWKDDVVYMGLLNEPLKCLFDAKHLTSELLVSVLRSD